MPSGLLHDQFIRYYHPVDDLVEYTKAIAWTGTTVDFVQSLFTSGIKPNNTTAYLNQALSTDYNDVENASGFTMAIWVSGFLNSDGFYRYLYVGFGNAGDTSRNTIRIFKDHPQIQIGVEIEGTVAWKDWTPAPSSDDNWHFIVVDARYETSGWRRKVSLDGSDWVTLEVDSQAGAPGIDERTYVFLFREHSAAPFIVDEIVLWGDNDLFTAQELSNLYELGNTYNKTMNQYTSTFGTTANSGIDYFIHGSIQTSGDISLYIPGQKDIKSLDLYMHVATSINDNHDNFIYGYDALSGNIDQYLKGYQTISSGIDLYISGIPGASINLYTVGPILTNDNIDDFTMGHLPISGNFPLFLRGRLQDINAFVSVSDNNPSDNFYSFIHGVPSGESTIFYIGDSITFFISDEGEDRTIDSSWSAFTKVADALTISYSGTWQSFVKGGNIADNNINLYLNSHASGDSPHGTLIISSFTTFINGQATQDGDEGLLFDGYFVDNLETPSFAKVHLGLNDTLNLYVSGEISVVLSSVMLDLFTFGILDTVSGSHILYVPGKELINDTFNLFVFGIQDIVSGSPPLYIEVTDIRLLNQISNLYSHGF